MTPLLIGQILGISFACGLNLYLTVAAIGLLSRFGLIQTLPPGLHGLEGWILIVSAGLLYLVEAVIDKVRHADSLWDAIHTFIRPPAAALLAVGLVWGGSPLLVVAAAAIALFTALTAHGTKAGLRLALNTGMPQRDRRAWLSAAEDLLAIAFATMALLDPYLALISTGTILVLLLLVGPRYWRAFRLGTRSLGAWLRTLFAPARWREVGEIPRPVRARLDPVALGTAPPRGTRAALHGLAGAGPYRNGWLIITATGPLFIYRTLFGYRTTALPLPRAVEVDHGVWADTVHVEAEGEVRYRLYLLKDGPSADLVTEDLRPVAP